MLRDVGLKPQNCSGALLKGRVAEIEFAWKWGGSADGSTSFVRETTLSIRGTSLRLIARSGPPLSKEKAVQATENDTNATTAVDAAPAGYMDRILQQIFDHLTLNITDVDLSVECATPETGRMILEAKALQLISFGRTEEMADGPDSAPAPCLSQQLSLGLFQAFIVDGTNADHQLHHPLIDPIAYTTSVRRVSGRRFLNFTTGLEVLGEVCGSNELVVHAGSAQVAALSNIANDLLAVLAMSGTSSKPDEQLGEKEQPVEENSQVPPDSSPSTFFRLPFPSLLLFLPNGAKIRMPSCMFQYQMDGSCCSLNGSEGILVNDSETPFLQMLSKAVWEFDFIESKFSVLPCTPADGSKDPAEEVDVVGKMVWDEENIKQVINGLFEMQKEGQSLIDRAGEGSTKSSYVATNSRPWSFAVYGQIDVTITGKNNEWIQMSIDSPTFALSETALFATASIAGAAIGPTSFGNAVVKIPPIDLFSEDLLSFQSAIQIELLSTSVLTDIQSFVGRLADIEGRHSPQTGVHAATHSLPFAVEIPAVVVTVSSPKSMKVNVESICMNHDCTAKIKSVAWTEGPEGMSGLIFGISLLSVTTLEIHVERLESLFLPGAIQLAAPTESIKVKFKNEQLFVDLPIVKCKMCNTAIALEPLDVPVGKKVAILPYPVNLRLKRLWVHLDNESKKHVSLSQLHIHAFSDKNYLSVETKRAIRFRLESSPDNWLDGSVEATSVSVKNGTFEPKSFCCGGLSAGPCSYGSFSLSLPSFQMPQGSALLCLKDHVCCMVQSTSVATSIQSLVTTVLDGILGVEGTANKSSGSTLVEFPFAVGISQVELSLSEPKPILVQVKGIQFSCNDSASIESVTCSGGPVSFSAAIFGISLLSIQNPELHIARVESMHLPGTAKLTTPIEGVNIKYENDELSVELSTVSCMLYNAKTAVTSNFSGENAVAAETGAAFLPCPLHVCLEKLCVYSSKNLQFCVFPIDLTASPFEKHLSFATNGLFNIHLESSSDSWIDFCFEPISFSLNNGSFEPKSFCCEGLHAGPICSFGEVSLDLPSFKLVQESKEISVDGVICCKVHSIDVVSSVQHLIMDFLDQFTVSNAAGESDSGLITTNVPEGSFEISDLGARISAHGIIANASHMSCVRILMSDTHGASASVSGIRVDGLSRPTQVITLDWIDAFFLPGAVSLTKPVATTKFTYTEAAGLHAEFSLVAVVMLDNGSTTPSEIMDLPFPIHCFIEELLLEMNVANEGIKTWNIEGLQIEANTVKSSALLTGAPGKKQPTTNIHISATIDQLCNDLLKASQISANGIYGPSNVFSNLQARVGTASVATGFSSVEWSQVFGAAHGGENKLAWMLPHAHIDRFKAGLAYKGKLVSTETVIHLYAFTGDSATTLDDIVSHYSKTALQQMPSLISGTTLLGENVVDMGARNVGSVALRGTLAGSVGGSVGGLVAADGIRGAIQSGKKSRGATEDDRYHFGDFSKGLIRSVKMNAKAGASMRQDGSDDYEIGDFSRGAAAGMGKYTEKNKERLGSAGGSSLGMAIGAVALGPIGLVAGSVLGAKAGAKAFASSKESAGEADNQEQDQCHVGREANLVNDSLLPSAPQSTSFEQDPFQTSGQTEVLPSASIPTLHNPAVARTDDFFEEFGLSQPKNAQQPGQCPSVFQQPPARAQVTSYSSHQQPHQVSREGGDDPLSIFTSSNSSTPGPTSQYQFPSMQSADPCVQQPIPPQNQTMQQVTPLQYNYQEPTVPSQYHNSEQQRAAQSQSGMQQQSHASYHQQTTSSESTTYQQQQQQVASARNVQMQQRRAPPTQNQGYRFGDVTRLVIAQGKKNSGRSENSGYQFGDFTRGLFGGKK